jgi:hypothetical protein
MGRRLTLRTVQEVLGHARAAAERHYEKEATRLNEEIKRVDGLAAARRKWGCQTPPH